MLAAISCCGSLPGKEECIYFTRRKTSDRSRLRCAGEFPRSPHRAGSAIQTARNSRRLRRGRLRCAGESLRSVATDKCFIVGYLSAETREDYRRKLLGETCSRCPRIASANQFQAV